MAGAKCSNKPEKNTNPLMYVFSVDVKNQKIRTKNNYRTTNAGREREELGFKFKREQTLFVIVDVACRV